MCPYLRLGLSGKKTLVELRATVDLVVFFLFIKQVQSVESDTMTISLERDSLIITLEVFLERKVKPLFLFVEDYAVTSGRGRHCRFLISKNHHFLVLEAARANIFDSHIKSRHQSIFLVLTG